ncbi:MAG TPA: M12 family metallo-peptidase, partial [Planctomycetota bacterium]|nr:M12 family metallo-peptidase [Planctomycetota bacterium]
MPVLAPRAAEFAALTALDRAVFVGVPLPIGAVDLELERVALEDLGFGFHVDGRPAPDLLDGLDLSVWLGRIPGEPASEAMVSFSRAGVRGWVRAGSEFWHLMPQPGAGNDWSESRTFVVAESELAALGLSDQRRCGLDELAVLRPEEEARGGALGAGAPGCEGWVCPLAIETDFQLFQVFGDLPATVAYTTTLLGAASGRYEEQIDTTLTYPYLQFYTQSNDPWSTPESGGSMIDMLGEFESAWGGNVPADAKLGVFVSGAGLGGGVAYLSALCDSTETITFAVCGNIDGETPFPVQQGPTTWDFIVFTHELGHNFSSPHTHDYEPPIDTCAFGGCIPNGTIMSYCHQCDGGLLNMTTYFHPIVVEVMKSHAGACLDSFVPLAAGSQPSLLAPGQPTTVSVAVTGSPVGPVELHYRFDGGPYQVLALTDLGSGLFEGTLPPAECGQIPEYFFSMTDATCGAFQSDLFQPDVGVELVLLTDDLESETGWTVGAPGDSATSGIWTRVDPNGTAAQPGDDHTPGGTQCYVTGQGSPGGSLGENDVDGGTTTLVSRTIDLSDGDARVGYWRWYSNDTGAGASSDVFVVEVTNGDGSWVPVETVGPTGSEASGGWFEHQFDVADFVVPTAQVRLRFVAADLGTGSLVEAAVDDLRVVRVSCDVCQDSLGFGGPGTATLALCGPVLATGATAELAVQGAPPG